MAEILQVMVISGGRTTVCRVQQDCGLPVTGTAKCVPNQHGKEFQCKEFQCDVMLLSPPHLIMVYPVGMATTSRWPISAHRCVIIPPLKRRTVNCLSKRILMIRTANALHARWCGSS